MGGLFILNYLNKVNQKESLINTHIAKVNFI